MRLIFHIGMGKTGTTSIQHALRTNPKTLSNQNANYLGMWFDTIEPTFHGVAGVAKFLALNDHEKVLKAEHFFDNITEIANKHKVNTFIFSNESMFQAGPQLAPFLRTLKSKDLSISFVAYLRNARQWLPSAYTQWAVRHKTNEGPIQDFEIFARRAIGQYEGIRFWQDHFGADLTVRPFDTTVDVVQDFAATVGLSLPITDTRHLERSEPADTLLRAAFNNRFPDKVLPEKFDRFVTNSSRAPVPSLQAMADRCFQHEGVEEIIAERQELFGYIRNSFGIDLLKNESRPSKVPDNAEMQRRIIDYLVEVTFDQAQRLKRLERLMKDTKIESD